MGTASIGDLLQGPPWHRKVNKILGKVHLELILLCIPIIQVKCKNGEQCGYFDYEFRGIHANNESLFVKSLQALKRI